MFKNSSRSLVRGDSGRQSGRSKNWKKPIGKKTILGELTPFRYYLIGLSSGSRGTGQGELQTGITRFYLQDTKMLQFLAYSNYN